MFTESVMTREVIVAISTCKGEFGGQAIGCKIACAVSKVHGMMKYHSLTSTDEIFPREVMKSQFLTSTDEIYPREVIKSQSMTLTDEIYPREVIQSYSLTPTVYIYPCQKIKSHPLTQELKSTSMR